MFLQSSFTRSSDYLHSETMRSQWTTGRVPVSRLYRLIEACILNVWVNPGLCHSMPQHRHFGRIMDAKKSSLCENCSQLSADFKPISSLYEEGIVYAPNASADSQSHGTSYIFCCFLSQACTKWSTPLSDHIRVQAQKRYSGGSMNSNGMRVYNADSRDFNAMMSIGGSKDKKKNDCLIV